MAKGILSVIGKHGRKEGSIEPFAIIKIGAGERKLYRSGDVGIETLAERKVAQLLVVATLLEGSSIALEPEELSALGDMIEQMASDIEDSAFLDLVEEELLPEQVAAQ